MSSSNHENTTAEELQIHELSKSYGWSHQELALINYVRKHYSSSCNKTPTIAWKGLSNSLTKRPCSDWRLIKQKYAKLWLLLKSGEITKIDILSVRYLKKYVDGTLSFLDSSFTELTDNDLPLTIHEWGDRILDKIKTKNLFNSLMPAAPAHKLLTHDQIKVMLLNREKEKKNVLDIEDEDVLYLQRTIQNVIDYKLSEIINNNDSTSTCENKNEITNLPSKVISIDSESEDSIVSTTVNENTTNIHDSPDNNQILENVLLTDFGKRKMFSVHSEDTTTNQSIEVECSINKLDSWQDYIPLAIMKNIEKLRNEIITTNDNNSMKKNIKYTTSNKSLEVESTTIKKDASEEERKLNNNMNVMNFNIEVKVEHNNINKENIEEDIANECTITENDDKEESEKINMGLDRGVILTDNIKKENLDNSADESIEAELESTVNENCERKESKKINMELNRGVILTDDIQNENFVDNSTDESMDAELESTINENDEREESEMISMGLDSGVTLTDNIKEGNFVDNSADESMEVETESKTSENYEREESEKINMGLHSEVILEDDIKREHFVGNSADESMEVEQERYRTINENFDLVNIKLEHSNLIYESEQEAEMSDHKVKKFFKELADIMSAELSLEKQEEFKSRINEVITARLCHKS